MGTVTVRDHNVWFSHVADDPALLERLEALAPGEAIELVVDGVLGRWVRMAVGRDGRPTAGLRPTGDAEGAWRRLYADRRGEQVDIFLRGSDAPQAASASTPANPSTPVPPGALALIAHADWSTDPDGRWEARATHLPDGSWLAHAPALVGPLNSYLARLAAAAGNGRALVGFDFPIGVPRAYASSAGITSFPASLPALGHGPWANFYAPAETVAQINVHRPFYPRRPGGTRKAHLVEGLGVAGAQDLLRRCDRPHAGRPKAACSIFWVLGADQVGRAAIVGWRDVLAPALSRGDVGLWPFHGSLTELLGSRRVVIAETYPGEVYGHLGLPAGGSKRSQVVRETRGRRLLEWARESGVALAPDLVSLLNDGFGPVGDDEDPFDAVVGLFGLLAIVLGQRSTGEPTDDPAVQAVEGWIMGRQA